MKVSIGDFLDIADQLIWISRELDACEWIIDGYRKYEESTDDKSYERASQALNAVNQKIEYMRSLFKR